MLYPCSYDSNKYISTRFLSLSDKGCLCDLFREKKKSPHASSE